MAKRQPTRLLLDAQLVLLLCVGLASRSSVATHKRLRAYDATDFDLLVETIQPFVEIVVTPNIATETSNLMRHGNSNSRLTAALAAGLEEWTEMYQPSREAVQNSAYARLGLSDAAMLDVLAERDDTLLLTADLDLYLAGQYAGLTVENFNHLRASRVDLR